MITIRTFDENNPLLSKIRYELGKSLVHGTYYKKNGEFLELEDKTLNKLNNIDDAFYYGLFIEHDLIDVNNIELYENIAFDGKHINIFNYISLIITQNNLTNDMVHLKNLRKEMFDILEYKESVHSLIDYYLLQKENVQFSLSDRDELE